MHRLQLIRDVTQKECSWLPHTFWEGDWVYEYEGCTYGCITPNGIAITIIPDKTPFYEIPLSAVYKEK